MKLLAPNQAPSILLKDSNGVPVQIGTGRRVLLAFFRDVNCPFCNVRVFQLTQRHKELAAAGLEVIAFFSSSPEDVARFVKQRPRPFRVVADPENIAYLAYGVQKSFPKKVYGVLTRLGMWILGMKILGVEGTVRGMGGLNTTNIMPADFLVNEFGNIVEAYYGEDPGDHIPMERIEQFAGVTNKASVAGRQAA